MYGRTTRFYRTVQKCTEDGRNFTSSPVTAIVEGSGCILRLSCLLLLPYRCSVCQMMLILGGVTGKEDE